MCIHETRIEVRQYGTLKRDDSIPYKLDDMIDALIRARDEIPEEYRASAQVDCDPEYELGEYYPALSVCYYRPETADEKEGRISALKAQLERLEEGAMEELERIRAKLREFD